jgi:hypothetical protein
MKLFTRVNKLMGWLANIATIVGVVLTSYDIYPVNLAVMLVASTLWVVTGLIWRRPELWTLNALIFLIYLHGLIK